MHVDLAAVRLNEAASNRQSKAGAALLPCDVIVDLLELIEDSLPDRRPECRNRCPRPQS